MAESGEAGPKAHTERIYQGRVFELVRREAALPNGACTRIDLIRHPGAAAIVALNAREELLLVRQYRPVLGEWIWEIPAGTRDPGESAADCAARELVEETGWRAGRLERLGAITPLPGYCDERVVLFLATELVKARRQLDADEVIELHATPFDAALGMAFDGTIQDAKSIIALMWTARRLGRL